LDGGAGRGPPGPTDDATAVTAGQLGAVVGRLIAARHWRVGDPDILIICDAGYDVARLAFVLADLPVELLGRLRSDRVLRLPAPPRRHGARGGRPPKHGPEFALDNPATWPNRRPPPRPKPPATARRRPAAGTGCTPGSPTVPAGWTTPGELPIIEGTLIRLQVDHLPGDRDPKPVWLWSSRTGITAAHLDRFWQAFLRRFDLEHTFRLFKQTLGWTRPKLRTPQAADRWTWLVIACHTQLRLARPLADDLRRPWERPAVPGRLTPARVRRGFRNLRAKTTLPGEGSRSGGKPDGGFGGSCLGLPPECNQALSRRRCAGGAARGPRGRRRCAAAARPACRPRW
jgi:hypothetical protein